MSRHTVLIDARDPSRTRVVIDGTPFATPPSSMVYRERSGTVPLLQLHVPAFGRTALSGTMDVEIHAGAVVYDVADYLAAVTSQIAQTPRPTP